MNRVFVASTWALLSALAACTTSDPERADPRPIGPVAHDAAEAYPDAPTGVPALTREQIAEACNIAGRCAVGTTTDDGTVISAPLAVALMDLCVHDLVYSAERAIPLSGFSSRERSADQYVACLVANQADCTAARACDSARATGACQEDGCTDHLDRVTCAGDVATVVKQGVTTTRDCALAHATCSADSATGCTDRPYTQCPAGPRADRCDGNVRLGCDGYDQVSYRDCTRLGGTCVSDAQGVGSCQYSGTPDECANDETRPPAQCDGTALLVCVNDVRVSLPDSSLCQP